MILKMLLNALGQTVWDDPAGNSNGNPAKQPSATTLQHNTSPTNMLKTEKSVTKQKSGAKDINPTFFGNLRQVKTCVSCKKDFSMDALCDPDEKFVCPSCDRKESDETSI